MVLQVLLMAMMREGVKRCRDPNMYQYIPQDYYLFDHIKTFLKLCLVCVLICSNPSQAYVDMIVAMEWSSFVVVYEESEGLVRLQEVLKLAPKKKKAKEELKIRVRQLTRAPKADNDGRAPPDYRSGNPTTLA